MVTVFSNMPDGLADFTIEDAKRIEHDCWTRYNYSVNEESRLRLKWRFDPQSLLHSIDWLI